MIFNLNFNYKENCEYLFRTYSYWSLKGRGTWEVDADELIEELNLKNVNFYSIKNAIEDYLWVTLGKDNGSIEFNKEDFESLVKYIEDNYET